jgi:hypothetical protein
MLRALKKWSSYDVCDRGGCCADRYILRRDRRHKGSQATDHVSELHGVARVFVGDLQRLWV